MDNGNSPNEITRESLVNVLEILHNLATPEPLDTLLCSVVNAGKEAIVAEAGLLWLLDSDAQTLTLAVPVNQNNTSIAIDQGWVGKCAREAKISNLHDCREDSLFARFPSKLPTQETRSLLNVPIVGQANTVIGVMQWLGADVGQFDNHDEWIGPTLAAQAAIAIQHERMTDDLLATAALGQEVALAKEIQMSTLPNAMPKVEGYDLHGHFQPTDHTGGDLFDVVLLSDQLFLLLGDATGHGFGPALSATQMQAMLRVAFRLGADLDSAFVHVNNQLEEDLPDDRFITAFVGFLDPKAHQVTYHSGGQGPILVYRASSDSCEWHKPTHFPMGVMPMSEAPQAERLALGPGDILALISDGVYEYNNEQGEEFGEQRMQEFFASNHHLDTLEINASLLKSLNQFAGSVAQADDITLVLVKRQIV